MPKMARTWSGMTLLDQKNRAAGRALIAIGTQTALETKDVTHVISGTLRRSVHAAPAGYEPDVNREEATAEQEDMLLMFAEVQPEHVEGMHILEVGSWLEYACAEWVGRGHPGITQGLELARTRADEIMVAAFAEEGLA